MKDPTGKTAPAGGFQNGGWYSGYQYVNGSFAPQAGMIHPESQQQGAGQAVSAEVNRQSSLAQGQAPNAIQNYVDQQNSQNQGGGGGAGGMGGYDAGGAGGAQAGTGAGIGYTAPEALNLPKLYESLYQDAGISDLEKEYAGMQTDYTNQKAKINDNPFLSEATRVGRVAKIEQLFGERTANIQNDIATKKADIETKLNMQTKQFDINSQAAQQAMTQFNQLLEMGALNNASGQDIANITRSTGLSSDAIKSAITANQKKNMQTQIIQYDDGQNQGFAVVDANSGAILNKQVISASKPTKASLGKSGGSGGGGGGLTASQAKQVTVSARKALATVDAATNEDKLISLDEYKRAVQMLMTSTGIDGSSADEYLSQAFSDLGYRKWKW